VNPWRMPTPTGAFTRPLHELPAAYAQVRPLLLDSNMRCFGLALVSLVAATTAAHADPIGAPTEAGTQSTNASYIDGGFEGGANDGYLTLGFRVELGTRVAPGLWVHAILADGGQGKIFATGSGTYTQLRAGADLMSCRSSGVLCIFVGADVGVEQTTWTGHDDPWFSDDSSTPMDTTDDHHRVIGVARFGVDIGGTNLRWRPSIEVTTADDGATSFNGTQSIAYRF
jgi:hypothetical protein